MKTPESYVDNVFINCPFDGVYHPMFEAIVFTIHDCGFIARCAREEEDSGDVRCDKLIRIIDECKYGIHDISKADVDAETGLARFNMPLELGLFLGAQRFTVKGNYNKEKKVLVLDKEQYRYQIFISDLAGTDISSHDSSIETLIIKVRNFLFSGTRRKSIPGGTFIASRFSRFTAALPGICSETNWHRESLNFIEYSMCVSEWIEANPI